MLTYTIAICTYKRPKVLARSLARLAELHAKDGDIQVAVINNGMDPETKSLALSTKDFQQPVQHYFEERAGVSYARNAAIKHCQSDVLVYLDDDFLIGPHWLESVRDQFAKDSKRQIGMLGGPVDLLWDNAPPSWYHDGLASNFSALNYGDGVFELKSDSQWLSEGNSAYWTECILSAGGFSEHLGRKGKVLLSNEGNELRERLIEAGSQIRYDSRMIVSHILHEERIRSVKWLLKRNFWTGASEQIQRFTRTGKRATLQDIVRFSKFILTQDLRSLAFNHNEDRSSLNQRLQAHQRLGCLYAMIRYR